MATIVSQTAKLQYLAPLLQSENAIHIARSVCLHVHATGGNLS